MKCAYCGLHDATADSDYCAGCEGPMREAFALLFAGLAELFLADREQETRDAA
jgi:hypothetical protein